MRPTLLSILVVIGPALSQAADQPLRIDQIKLPPGFQIEVYADHVKNARSLALGPEGVVFVGTRSAGNVYALVDSTRHNRADRVLVLASGLENPNGVAFHDGALYVAERSS